MRVPSIVIFRRMAEKTLSEARGPAFAPPPLCAAFRSAMRAAMSSRIRNASSKSRIHGSVCAIAPQIDEADDGIRRRRRRRRRTKNEEEGRRKKKKKKKKIPLLVSHLSGHNVRMHACMYVCVGMYVCERM
jgi:hypothetical protein